MYTNEQYRRLEERIEELEIKNTLLADLAAEYGRLAFGDCPDYLLKLVDSPSAIESVNELKASAIEEAVGSIRYANVMDKGADIVHPEDLYKWCDELRAPQ